MTNVPDITRYETDPKDPNGIMPSPYGHLVFFTDHDLVVDHLLAYIKSLEHKLGIVHNYENAPL